MKHRVEVLRPGSTPEFDFWSNASGSIYLCRERHRDAWQAIVDGDVVVDRTHPFDEESFVHAVHPLAATGPAGLVPLLAMQEHIHVILDHQVSAEVVAE